MHYDNKVLRNVMVFLIKFYSMKLKKDKIFLLILKLDAE